MDEIVIGNAWGDEGKGLVTDWLSDPDSVVVRFSGGAQAGHTVVEPGGRRHVFHHFGSGTFRHAATFLSEFFYADPVAFNYEYTELEALGVTPKVFVAPGAAIVTPYDRILNQLTEMARGVNRHGSCGFGIGEAARRAEGAETRLRTHLNYGGLRTMWEHTALRATLEDHLDRIAADSLEQVRERGLNVDRTTLAADMVRGRRMFLRALPLFLERTAPLESYKIKQWSRAVFEGSQGLLLDRDLGEFPFVTRAKTGLKNVETLRGTLADARVWFVSRSYFTRHGAGPLPGEDFDLRHRDETNLPNSWQGNLRFAPRCEEVLRTARTRALAEVDSTPAEVRTFVSWTDVPGTEHLRTDAWSNGPTRLHCHV